MPSAPSPEGLLQQGIALHLAGELAEAERFYRTLLQLDPRHPDALYLLGELARQSDDIETAQALLEQARLADPSNPAFHVALGNAFAAAGSDGRAIQCYQDALRLDPGLADAHLNLGAVLLKAERLEEAEQSLLEALRLKPGLPEAYNNLGAICMARNQMEQAEHYYLRALEIHPGASDAHLNLANLLRKRGEVDEARQHYGQVLASTGSPCLRIRMATLLPPVYASLDEIHACRARLARELDALAEMPAASCDPLQDGGGNNFYLVYQGQDDKAMQQQLAQLYRRVYQPHHRTVSKRARSQDEKIRVGFISSFFRDHTIGELNRGIIAHLSRELFEVSVFSIGSFGDPVARFIKEHADHYHVLPRDLAALENFIAQQGMDVLLYTDIGMEPVSYFLAFSRLAPVQCVTWGHPVTTGIDTVDYFISSEHQETQDSDRYYTEKLVRLANIPAYFYPPDMPGEGKTRADFGMPDDVSIYLCPQSLFKLHPEFDEMVAQILRRDERGRFVLMAGQYPQWTTRLKQRLSAVMPDVADRVVFLPRLPYADYLRLMVLADVVLDPLHFGGGKTTLDALSLGVPVVTLPGKFMRGRAAYACYMKMGIAGCIASDRADYVDKALAIAADHEYRRSLSVEIREKSRLLQENSEMVRELEQFFLKAVKGLG